MNKKIKEIKKYNLLQTIKFNSRTGNKKNYIKYWKGTSRKHFITICEIAHKLINQGYDIYTESIFINGSRADICAISNDSIGYIIEILHSETEKLFEKKINEYPIEWNIIKVNSKNFNIKKWEL